MFVDDIEEEILIKLIDFSNSSILNSVRRTEESYSDVHFAAPEIFLSVYSEKSDIWSCGILMYYMLFGKYPFEGG